MFSVVVTVKVPLSFATCSHQAHDSQAAGFVFGKSVLKTQHLEKFNSIFIHNRATVFQNKVVIACWNQNMTYHFATHSHPAQKSPAGFAFGKSVLKTQQSEKLNIILIHSPATVSQSKVFIAFRKRVNLI